MKNFFTALLFFFFIGILFILPGIVFYFGREYYSLARVMQEQKEDRTTLLGFSYNGEIDVSYKTLLMRVYKPDIFIVGTSRVLQFRKEFFTPSSSFVNAGIPILHLGNISTIQKVVDEVPNDGKSRIMIFGLERNLFTGEHPVNSDLEERSLLARIIQLPGMNLRRIYLDYFAHKFTIRRLIQLSQETNNIGFGSIVNGGGYRYDGSSFDRVDMSVAERYKLVSSVISDKAKEIRDSQSSLAGDPSEAIAKNMKSLEEIVKACKEKNITVVGYIPSNPTVINKEMYASTTVYGKETLLIDSDIQVIFIAYGFHLYNLSDIAVYQGREDEFRDTVHMTDVMAAKMTLYLGLHDPTIGSVVDVTKLRDSIKHQKNGFLNF